MIRFIPFGDDASAKICAYDGESEVGSCSFSVQGYDMSFLTLDCEDSVIAEGLARSAMNYAANRGAYTAKAAAELYPCVFERLGFCGGDIISAEIPQAFCSGCTCGHEKPLE